VLGLMPGVEVVGCASDGIEVLALALSCTLTCPHGLAHAECGGVEATRLLREREPDIKVVVLTTYADDRSVIDALEAGARGYLTKDAGTAEIRDRTPTSTRRPCGDRPCSSTPSGGRLVAPTPRSTSASVAGLTPRETEVLSLIAAVFPTSRSHDTSSSARHREESYQSLFLKIVPETVRRRSLSPTSTACSTPSARKMLSEICLQGCSTPSNRRWRH